MPFNDEVEKIVSAACISFIDNGMTCDGAIRSALRAYGELMIKKIEDRFGGNDDINCGLSDAISDIAESLEER